jgi:hypothetical protein
VRNNAPGVGVGRIDRRLGITRRDVIDESGLWGLALGIQTQLHGCLDIRNRAIGTGFWVDCPDILATQGKMLGTIGA